MKRMHVHIGVTNLDESVRFYSALFGAEPSKRKSDYAKWMLQSPHLNFAISTRSGKTGLDHFGLQVDDAAELGALRDEMSAANLSTHGDGETTCCYARSEKSWVQDPNGIAWEAYHTMADAQIYAGADPQPAAEAACCTSEPLQGGLLRSSAGHRGLLLRSSGMTVTIYHNPACGTSRKVLALIRDSSEEPHVIEYLKTPPGRDELASLIDRMGIPVRDVLRRKGTPYDELRLDDPALTDDQLLDAMMAHPILINRPIVVTPNAVRLCRPAEAVLDILNEQRPNGARQTGEAVAGSDRPARPTP